VYLLLPVYYIADLEGPLFWLSHDAKGAFPVWFAANSALVVDLASGAAWSIAAGGLG